MTVLSQNVFDNSIKGIYYGRDGGKTMNMSDNGIGSKRVQLEGGWKVKH